MPLPVSNDYKVRLDVFEGPLDLLLHLIREEEVDIYDIPIGRIADQYQEYLRQMEEMNLEVAGEFLVMAATLMMIKSRMLLPAEARPEEEEEEEDPRWDLVRQLVEYKKFKDAAMQLDALQAAREDVFARAEAPDAQLGKAPEMALRDVGLYDLIRAFGEALRKVRPEDRWEVFPERFSVAEKVEDIRERLRTKERFSLTRLFADMHSRQEVACAFLALLELIRLHVARAVQVETYGEIEVMRGDGKPDAPEGAAGGEGTLAGLEEAGEVAYSTEGLSPDAKRKAERLLAKARAKKTKTEEALEAIEALAAGEGRKKAEGESSAGGAEGASDGEEEEELEEEGEDEEEEFEEDDEDDDDWEDDDDDDEDEGDEDEEEDEGEEE
jgi:segregation and condensation protein A